MVVGEVQVDDPLVRVPPRGMVEDAGERGHGEGATVLNADSRERARYFAIFWRAAISRARYESFRPCTVPPRTLPRLVPLPRRGGASGRWQSGAGEGIEWRRTRRRFGGRCGVRH